MMSAVTKSIAMEFKAPELFRTDRRSAARWILSYALHYWYLDVSLVVGAVGNAALAALVPILVGRAFDEILKTPPRTEELLPIALIIAGSQVVRGSASIWPKFQRRAFRPAHRAGYPPRALYKLAGEEHDLSQPAADWGCHGSGDE